MFAIPEGVKTIDDDIDNDYLKKIIVSKTIIDVDFNGCSKLETIEVDKDNLNYASENEVLYDKNKETLLCYPRGKKDTMFVIPEGVKTVNRIYADYLTKIIVSKTIIDVDFSGCSKLETIEGDANNAIYFAKDGVLYKRGNDGIELAAYPCAKQESSYTVLDGVKKLNSRSFYGAKNLRSVTLPKSLESIEARAFMACGQLRSVFIQEGVTEIVDNAFARCGNLEAITLPKSLKYFGITEEEYQNGEKASGVFSSLSYPSDIYYAGSEAEWNQVIKDEIDENVTIHFNVTDNPISTKKSYIEMPEEVEADDSFSLRVKFCDAQGNLTSQKGEVYFWITKDNKLVTDYDIAVNYRGGEFVRVGNESGLFYLGKKGINSSIVIDEIEIHEPGTYTIHYIFTKPEVSENGVILSKEDGNRQIDVKGLPSQSGTKVISSVGGTQSLSVNENALLDLKLADIFNSTIPVTTTLYVWAENVNNGAAPTDAFVVKNATERYPNLWSVATTTGSQLQILFKNAGNYRIQAAPQWMDFGNTTSAEIVTALKENDLLLSFNNNIVVTDEMFITMKANNKTLSRNTNGVYMLTLQKDDAAEVVLQLMDGNDTALNAYRIEYGVPDGIVLQDMDTATKRNGKAEFTVLGKKVGIYQLTLKIQDSYYILLDVTVTGSEEGENQYPKLMIEYPATAKIGETISLKDIYYLSDENKKVDIDLSSSNIQLTGEGKAIESLDSSTGAVKIKNDKQYIGSTITMIAYDTLHNVTGRTSIKITGKSNGSSGGGSFGGGGSLSGGSHNSGNAGTIIILSPNQQLNISKSSASDDVIQHAKDAASQKADFQNELVTIVGDQNYSVTITAQEEGKTVTEFTSPVRVMISLDESARKDIQDSVKLTLAKVTSNENGETVLIYVGGYYDATTGIFQAYVTEPGDYVLIEDAGIQKITLQIGKNDAIVNGIGKPNDTAPFIYNNRTMVPLRYIADILGASIEWDENTRTVTLVVDGVAMQMTIDQVMEGFDTAPMIYNNRTMVPVSYIARKLGANIIYVPETQEIVIVK